MFLVKSEMIMLGEEGFVLGNVLGIVQGKL